MKAEKIITRGERKYYIYPFGELRKWYELGKKEGNVGMLLFYREGLRVTYRGFGTIEHPLTDVISITMTHNEKFDGKTIEELDLAALGKLESKIPPLESWRLVMIDMGAESGIDSFKDYRTGVDPPSFEFNHPDSEEYKEYQENVKRWKDKN